MHITLRYIIALLLLCLLVQEAHEITHMLVDHLINGCGGTRYFLYWQLCETGDANKVAITAMAGPLINFIFLWLGYFLLAKNTSIQQKGWGFTFIIATLPLQRLQAFVFRGSDEITSFRKMMFPAEPFKGAAVIIGLLLVVIMLAPALYRAFNYLKGKNQWLTMAAFLILPFIVALGFQHIGANTSIRAFLFSSTGISLLPSWLSVLDLLMLLLFIPASKSIGKLFAR